jgi:predicted RNase H-like HicB family nuclease
MRFAIVIELAGSDYSGYVPDVPGCAATGRSVAEVRERLTEALAFHFDGLRVEGIAVPLPSTEVSYVQVRECPAR